MSTSPPAVGTLAADDRTERRAVRSIVAAIGVSSVTVSTWMPFLPLYVMQVGARDDADAAFWVALAMGGQGLARLLAGPAWGILSDRVGRKKMFVRALFFSALSTLVAGLIQAPWQLCLALGLHGLFSGVVPAATALLSVSVADTRVKAALSRLTGAQYIGMAIGPSLGALLALTLGYRGVFLASAVVCVAIAFVVVRSVPQDAIPVAASGPGATPLPRFQWSGQLGLALFVLFVLVALSQLRQVSAPIALLRVDQEAVEALTGINFTVSAIASVAGVLMVARWFHKASVRRLLIIGSALAAASHLLLALASTPAGFIASYALASLLHTALYPTANTLIALNVARDRRGTAFGLASAMLAMGLIAGPMGGALFAATSLTLGYGLLAGLLLALSLLLALRLREPSGD